MYKHFVVFIRGVAQPGSALEWGSRGRWFKSSRPDFFARRFLVSIVVAYHFDVL